MTRQKKHIESPAKVLEHEFAHAVTEAKSSDLHQFNVDTARGSDKPYDTKDDRRKKQELKPTPLEQMENFPIIICVKNTMGDL